MNLLRFVALSMILFLPFNLFYLGDGGLNFSTLFHLPDYIPIPSRVGADISGSEFYIYVRNLGDEANFSVSYTVSPFTENISLSFKPESFILGSGGKEYVFVGFKILAKTTPGLYRVKIFVEGKIGSVGSASSKEVLIEVFGGEVYVVNVFTGLRDGTGIPAKILVDAVRDGKRYTVFEDIGPTATFYLVKGDYFFSALYLGRKMVEEEVFVEKNFTAVNLYLKLIEITGFEVERKPKFSTDPLIYKISIRCISDEVRRKNVTLYINLNTSSGVESYELGSYEINGRQTLTVRGYIDPPGRWNNGTYSISIEVLSNDIELDTYVVELKIFVSTPTPKFVERINLSMLAIASAVGAAIGSISSILVTKIRKKEEKIPKQWLYKVIILGKEKPLLIYDAIDLKNREDLLGDDRYLLVTSMMGVLITLVKERGGMARGSFTLHGRKYIYTELENDFYLILETIKLIEEDDLIVKETLERLADYINKKHEENGIFSPEYIVSTRRYSKIIGDLSHLVE